MTCGEPAHKEPQVTTDEFIARNGEDTEDTRDDVRGERVNVRVHIPTFSVTPGVFDIFRRGEIYFCFWFLPFLPSVLPPWEREGGGGGPCQTGRVPLHGTPASMTCAFSQSLRVTLSLRIRTKASKRERGKGENCNPLRLPSSSSRMRLCMQFRRHGESAQY